MKPATLEIPAIQSESNLEEETVEPSQALPGQSPNHDSPDESPTLENTEHQIQKVESTHSVQTESTVPSVEIEAVAATDVTTEATPIDANSTDPDDETQNATNIRSEPELSELLATVEDSLVDEPSTLEGDVIVQERSDLFDNAVSLEEEIDTNDTTDDTLVQNESILDVEPDVLVEEEPEFASVEQSSTEQLPETESQPTSSKPTSSKPIIAEQKNAVDNVASDETTGLQSVLVRQSKQPTEATLNVVSEQEDAPQEQEKDASQEIAVQDAPSTIQHRARLVLHVPESAEVFLMNQKMSTMGTTRLFNVPVNDPTKDHSYSIRVVTQNGLVVESTQLIRAGQRLELTFNDQSGTLALQQISPFE